MPPALRQNLFLGFGLLNGGLGFRQVRAGNSRIELHQRLFLGHLLASAN